MTIPFSECAACVRRLDAALERLAADCAALRVPPPDSREWYRVLVDKLRPQLGGSAFLVAAVVGGTNIGKSVIFNHLAGGRASATSPLASGTKHPVCLVPDSFERAHDLAAVLPGFELVPWTSSEAALEESDRDRLFWRSSRSLPDNLLVLDTPDIDSDARVNWQRADRVRRVADVLIAVLTQQKYNDAAVKEFFRRAAAEDKFVLVVFNQVHLPDDEAYWPLWLKTFCDETGLRPAFVYLAPHDRRAAEENRLEFYERCWPPRSGGANVAAETAAGIAHPAGRRLNADLASLRFDEIRLRTLRGSLNVLLSDDGVGSLLREIRQRSDEFRSAAELLATHRLAEIESWPTVPNALIVAKIRAWWQSQRSGWSGAVHGFYNRVGEGLTKTYRLVRDRLAAPERPPLEVYRDKEWQAILDAVDEVFARLNWFRELGNPLLQPRLEALLGATPRAELLAALRTAHEQCPLDEQLTGLITRELDAFREESPTWYRSLRQLDAVAAAARPAASIVLFMTGFGPVGHAIGQVAAETALASAVSVAGDVAAGGVTAAVGETWLSSTASSGAAWLEARFRRIHERFTKTRAEWLAALIQQHLLGSLPEELTHAATVPESEPFREVQAAVDDLRTLLVRIEPGATPSSVRPAATAPLEAASRLS